MSRLCDIFKSFVTQFDPNFLTDFFPPNFGPILETSDYKLSFDPEKTGKIELLGTNLILYLLGSSLSPSWNCLMSFLKAFGFMGVIP